MRKEEVAELADELAMFTPRLGLLTKNTMLELRRKDADRPDDPPFENRRGVGRGDEVGSFHNNN